MELKEIIGKKVVAIKGHNSKWNDKRVKHPKIEPGFILFDDGETYIELEEQDYYSYHDCSFSARTLIVWQNKERWNKMMTQPWFGDATQEI
jgi:hypothetical protein